MMLALAACASCIPDAGLDGTGNRQAPPPARASAPVPATATDPETSGGKKLVVLTWPD